MAADDTAAQGLTSGWLQLQPYLSGERKVPCPTYFICGSEDAEATTLVDKIPAGGELCPDLHYLGRAGKKKVAGLDVCYISGVYNRYTYAGEPAEDRMEKYERGYHECDVEEALIESGVYRDAGVDILLTAEWCGLSCECQIL